MDNKTGDILSANDGNKPKDPKDGTRQWIIKQLTKPLRNDPVGDIRPVIKRLRELEKAHEAGVPPEADQKPLPQSVLKFFGMEAPHLPVKEFRDARLQGLITPELMEFLYGKPDRENFLVPDDRFSKENLYSPDPPYLISQRKLYELKNGVQDPQGIPSPLSPDEIEAYRKAAQPSRSWWREDIGPRPTIKYDDKFREPPPVIKKIRSMLDNDKRLAEYDKEIIVFNILNGKYPLYGPGFSLRQSKESLGDIVLKKVEEYLAKKEIDLKTPRQIDAEAGVRILFEHSQDMAGLKQIKEEGWLSPVFKPITAYWHSEGEVLQSVQAIPKSRLDDLTPGGKTVREVLIEIVDSTVFESVRSAAKEKLE